MFSTKEVKANEKKKKIYEKCFSEDSRLDFLYCEIRSFSVNLKSLKRHPILLCFMSENFVWISPHFRTEFRDNSQCMWCLTPNLASLTINLTEKCYLQIVDVVKVVEVSAHGICKINDLLGSFCNFPRSQTSRSQRMRPPAHNPKLEMIAGEDEMEIKFKGEFQSLL